MKKKLTVAFSLILLLQICVAGEMDSLIGKSFKLDKSATQKYLKEKKVFPEEHLSKLDKFMDHLVVRWEKESIEVDAWSGSSTTQYKVVAETKKKIILKVKNTLGDWDETRIILAKDGYWQETDVFPGYREKFTLYTPQPAGSNRVAGSINAPRPHTTGHTGP